MRKLLILPFLLATLFLASWPLWSAAQLRAAIKARDLGGIESRVDWPSLRENLTRSLEIISKRAQMTVLSARSAHPWTHRCWTGGRPRGDATNARARLTLGTKTAAKLPKDDEDFVSDQLAAARAGLLQTPTLSIEAVAEMTRPSALYLYCAARHELETRRRVLSIADVTRPPTWPQGLQVDRPGLGRFRCRWWYLPCSLLGALYRAAPESPVTHIRVAHK